jgi:hypothetical protein
LYDQHSALSGAENLGIRSNGSLRRRRSLPCRAKTFLANDDSVNGHLDLNCVFRRPVYAGGQIEASDFVAARWDLVPRNRWEKTLGASPPTIAGIPLTRRWLIPQALRPKLYWSHPIMSAEEIRSRTQAVWDSFYSFGSIWKRSRFIKSSRGRLAFLLISKIYRQMYADTGIATDSARVSWSGRWARWLAKPCRHLFAGTPMPDLQVPMT